MVALRAPVAQGVALHVAFGSLNMPPNDVVIEGVNSSGDK